MMKKFTHIEEGKPSMVDVGDKAVTQRIAMAQSTVLLPEVMRSNIENGEIKTLKGPVFQTAILAGIQAAKRTSELIPLCHLLPLSKVAVNIEMSDELTVQITSTVKCEGKTGVEMEALTGASVAALTVYDMCKAFSQDIIIAETQLLSKSGGKTEFNRKQTKD